MFENIIINAAALCYVQCALWSALECGVLSPRYVGAAVPLAAHDAPGCNHDHGSHKATKGAQPGGGDVDAVGAECKAAIGASKV